VSAAVSQLEGYVRGLMGTRAAEQSPHQPFPQPECRVTSLEDHLAAAVMDGSCLSLVRYALAETAARPQAYAHVPHVTLQERHKTLAKFWGGFTQGTCSGGCRGSSMGRCVCMLLWDLPPVAPRRAWLPLPITKESIPHGLTAAIQNMAS
jgi:hypothetical protein